MSSDKTVGGLLTEIADILREGVNYQHYKLAQMPAAIRELASNNFQLGKTAGITEGIEQGKQAEYDAFWDAYQRKGRPTFLGSMFAGAGWRSETFYPKYNIVSDGYGCASMFYMFDYEGRTSGKPPLNLEERLNELGITIDLTRSFSPATMFQQANISVVPELDFSTFTGMGYIFYGADRVVTIRKLKVNENASWSNAFTSATALENITFEGVIGKSISFADSPKLTTASVQSIIDHLKDLTGATAQTLTFHATVGGKLTDAQKAAITAKNWTLVY